MPLTVREIEALEFTGKPIKHFDGGGLFLSVEKSGKYWRYAYRFNGDQKTLHIGPYGEKVGRFTLKQARRAHQRAKQQKEDGIDPCLHKQAEKRGIRPANEITFGGVASEWLGKKKLEWAASNYRKVEGRLKKDVLQEFGSRPIEGIETQEIWSCLSNIVDRGAIDTAHRVRNNFNQIFNFAIATGRCFYNPVTSLQGALPKAQSKSFSHITDPKRFGQFLLAIDGYEGSLQVQTALKILPHVYLRPKELRTAEWSEINCDVWKIPAHKMKGRQEHRVPLSRQVRTLLADYRLHFPVADLLFPSVRNNGRPISDGALNAAIKTLGFSSDEIVPHGLRHTASTMLNEKLLNPDVIEKSLAHRDSSMRVKYNHANYFEQRAEMMQYWSDQLDLFKELARGDT